MNWFKARCVADEEWLAQAAEALAEAERVVWRMAGESPAEAAELDEWRMRITLLRCDVARIKALANGPPPAKTHSHWAHVSAWG